MSINEAAHARTWAKVKQMLKAILGRGGVIVKEEARCAVCGAGETYQLGELFHSRRESVHLRCVPAYLRSHVPATEIAATIAVYLAERELRHRAELN